MSLYWGDDRLKSYNLPDISSRYNQYTSALITSISNSERDWDLISFNINSLNTLLTSKYTIPLSNDLYNDRTRVQQTRTCSHCFEKKYKTVLDEEGNSSKEFYQDKTEIPIFQIKLYDAPMDFMTRTFTGKTSIKSWDCPKCSNANKVSDTPTSDKRFGSNATFGVMYEQPKYTIFNRSSFDRISMLWCTTFLREIDMGLMAFQSAYFEQHGENMKETIMHVGDK